MSGQNYCNDLTHSTQTAFQFFFMKNFELFQMLEVHEYYQDEGNGMKSDRSQLL